MLKKGMLKFEMIWTIWTKSKLKGKMILKTWRKGMSNSDNIWTIWKKGKSKSEKI